MKESGVPETDIAYVNLLKKIKDKDIPIQEKYKELDELNKKITPIKERREFLEKTSFATIS